MKEGELARTVVLGLLCGYLHDSGAALIVDGKITAAVAEERVSRIKKDNRFPIKAIKKCLEIAELSMEEITHVFVGAQDIQYQPMPEGYFDGTRDVLFSGIGKNQPLFHLLRHHVGYRINRLLRHRPFAKSLHRSLVKHGLRPEVLCEFVDHHICHSTSVFLTSAATQSDGGYIFCVDAYGDGISVSAYHFDRRDSMPQTLHRMSSRVSPGAMYSAVTTYLGMKPNRHEGKVTGLAGYGDPKVLFDDTVKYLHYNEDTHHFEIEVLNEPAITRVPKRLWDILRHGRPKDWVSEWMKSDFDGHKKEDVAAAVQERLDVEIARYVQDVIGDDHPGSILLAGGGICQRSHQHGGFPALPTYHGYRTPWDDRRGYTSRRGPVRGPCGAEIRGHPEDRACLFWLCL